MVLASSSIIIAVKFICWHNNNPSLSAQRSAKKLSAFPIFLAKPTTHFPASSLNRPPPRAMPSKELEAPTVLSFIHPGSGKKLKIWMVGMFTCISTLVVLLGSCAVCCRLKKGTKQDEERSQHALLHELASPTAVAVTQEGELLIFEELPFIDLATIRSATDEFSDSNKLGQGGFGTVYKGTLPDGKEVAVKRLSRKSWQGLEEFKNEIMLIAKLQHRNLVKLLGCGTEGEEKVLIYEYMPNRSLDIFIFDSKRSLQLDWETCYNIIGGIARGLLYLHEDSRLKIVHRDLKPSNILLDHDMIAKISDFGMARIFCENQNTANTRRVVGT